MFLVFNAIFGSSTLWQTNFAQIFYQRSGFEVLFIVIELRLDSLSTKEKTSITRTEYSWIIIGYIGIFSQSLLNDKNNRL